MYIILGEPRDRESFLAAPGIYPAEVWFYEAAPQKGLSSPFYLLFFQQGFGGEYRLYNPRIHGPEKLFPGLQFGENSSNPYRPALGPEVKRLHVHQTGAV